MAWWHLGILSRDCATGYSHMIKKEAVVTLLARVASSLLALTLLCHGAPQRDDGRQDLVGWKIGGCVDIFELTSVTDSDPMGVAFTFRNMSDRVVTALSISTGSVHHYIDYFSFEGPKAVPGIPSQGVYVWRTSQDTLSTVENRTVVVSSVIFDDGTSSGNSDRVQRMFAQRAGRMLEVERIRRIFTGPVDRFLGSSGLKVLQRELGTAPATADDALSELAQVSVDGISSVELKHSSPAKRHGFLVGVAGARYEFAQEIQRLQKEDTATVNIELQRLVLSSLRRLCDSIAEKHRAYRAKMRMGETNKK